MNKTFKRFISVLLAVLMITTVIPMGAYAAETEDEAIQVSEIEESRDLYSKTYETSEGTNVVISAAVPLHYEEDGELKEIDNTLVKSDEDSSVLTNTANAYNVELPKKYTDDSQIKMDYEGNSISFKLLNDVNNSKGAVENTDEAAVDETDAESVAYAESNISNLSSDITYENVLPDTDFQYNVQPNALKENIILNNVPDEDYSVQYELNTGGLTAILNDDNSISLVNSKSDEIFMIEAPYMLDAEESICEDVTVSLEESENGYILTYVPNHEWLSDENTVYPITIDPTVTVLGNDSSGQNIEDTYVSSSSLKKKKNYSAADELIIKNDSTKSWACYNFVNLPTLPKNAKMINCKFNVYSLVNIDVPANLALYELSEDFDFDAYPINVMTWNSTLETKEEVVDVAKIQNSSTQLYFDITKVINNWYINSEYDRVLVMKSLDTIGDEIKIAATEYYSTDQNKIPYISMEYNYTNTNGINDSSSYITQDMNLSGVAYINEYTGQLTIEKNEFSSKGAIGDFILYYGTNVNGAFGNSWGENLSINYYKTLEKNSYNDDVDYILTNGDGSIEYISPSNGYTSSISEDENLITIQHSENDKIISETFQKGIVTNVSNDTYVLVGKTIKKDLSQQDIIAQTVDIEYNNANMIKSISDNVSSIKFEYNEAGKLYGITSYVDDENDSMLELVNEDNSENYIYSITDRYVINENSLSIILGKEENSIYGCCNIKYEYTDNELMVTTESGIKYKYIFNNLKQVTKVQEYSSDDTAGDYLTFEYGDNSTTISDGTDTYTEYFDLEGKLQSIVDQDGNATFAQYTDNLVSKVSQTRNSARNIADFYGFESSNDSFFKTNSGTVVVTDSAKFNGNSSVQLTAPAQTKAIFDNKINHLEKNSTYTVSMWIKKDENTNCSLTLTNGDSSGIFTTVNSQSTDGWQQFYCTIDTEDSNYLNVALTINNNESETAATVYVDNMYIQKSPYLTNVNLLQNGDFSNNLTNWTTDSQNISVISEDANTSTEDSNRLKIEGDYLSENSISQSVSINAKATGTKYTYGGWIKTVNTLPAKEGTNREISLAVYGIADDGTFTLLSKKEYSSYISNWQYIEEELSLPADNISQLKFVVSCNYQCGYVLFDGLSLSQDELYTIQFEYADDGETITGITVNETTIPLTENTESGEGESDALSYVYDNYGNITKIQETYSTGETDSEGNAITESIVSKFQYGNNGSLLTGEMSELGRWSHYLYDYFGNVASVTDANGNTVQYEYDNFQNLSAIVNQFESNYIHYDNREDGTETAETYTLRVQYTYTGNRLDKIETGNVETNDTGVNVFTPFNTYEFKYDQWGNQTDIYINETDITKPYIHYEYDDVNYHQLNAVKYINGQEIHYVYDNSGNIIYEYDTNNTDGNTLSYSYYYYDNGTCYGKKDLKTGTIESYQDGLTTVKDSGGSVLHSYGYDENGNLVEQIGNDYISINESSSNNSSALTTIVNNANNVISTEYDDFGRIVSEKLESDDPSSYILREYTYYDNNPDDEDRTSAFNEIFGVKNTEELDADVDTTNLIRFLTYYAVTVDEENIETKTVINQYRYLYSYDGDILVYTIATTDEYQLNNQESFVFQAYNSGNMLTANTAYLYNYDSHGNIANVELNRDEEAENHLDFTYDNNSGTKINNCLTNIEIVSNGQSTNFPITYDSFGNICNVATPNISLDVDEDITVDVNNINLNWARGSTLSSINGNITVNYTLPLVNTEVSLPLSLDLIDYQYDDNNLRTHKSINYSLNSLREEDVPTQLLSLFGIEEADLKFADASIDYIWRDNKLAGANIDLSGSLIAEGNSSLGDGSGKYSIVILYDQNDNAYGITVNKTVDSEGNAVNESNTFYYLKDADNTINAIIDSEGNKLVEYEYDSYGMVLNIDNMPGYRYLMFLNPLAYRDYIYDIESGMYYLQSRYYAPYAGRFISADSVLDTGSGSAMCTNLYSYCENNPTNCVDPTGQSKLSNLVNKSTNLASFVSGVASAIITLAVFVAKKTTFWSVVSKIATCIAGISTGIAFLSAIKSARSNYKNNNTKYNAIRNYNVALLAINIIILIVGEVLGGRVLKNNTNLAASLILATIGVRTITVIGVTFNLVNILAKSSLVSYKSR